MKMTVHQRLRAQRKSEHSKAVAARHVREILRNRIDQGGSRCVECRHIPLHPFEVKHMTEEEKEWRAKDAEDFARWDASPLVPEPGDPLSWHHAYALGYWS